MSIAAVYNNPKFLDALEGLQSFILDNNADIDMAYDWVSDQAEISSFVSDLKAWNMFYEIYDEAAE
jgi:hypothetical protein|tara:strand:- start:538 stop:735 length:198 start_codon:yes stop_codon:yes gene_type:complete